jgi:hypothetical protein
MKGKLYGVVVPASRVQDLMAAYDTYKRMEPQASLDYEEFLSALLLMGLQVFMSATTEAPNA